MAATSVVVPTRSEVLCLFRSLLRTARQFSDYNIREYTKIRTIDGFRQNRTLSDPDSVALAFSEAKAQLDLAKRQAVIYSLYAPKVKSIMDIKPWSNFLSMWFHFLDNFIVIVQGFSFLDLIYWVLLSICYLLWFQGFDWFCDWCWWLRGLWGFFNEFFLMGFGFYDWLLRVLRNTQMGKSWASDAKWEGIETGFLGLILGIGYISVYWEI